MDNNFQKMMDKVVEVKAKYETIEPKTWGINQAFMGMVKDIGELSKILMAHEGYREDLDKDTKKALEHQLTDVLYSIMVIGDKTGIDLEKSFWETMEEIEKKIDKESRV